MNTFFGDFKNTVKHWYIPLIMGILLIALGVYMFFVPVATYTSLVILFSVWFFTLGVMELFFAFQNQEHIKGWGWYLAGAILDVTVGTILISSPAIASVALPVFVAFTLMFRSFQGMGFAYDMQQSGIKNWGFLLFSSILTFIFSFLMFMNPVFAGISIVVLTAITLVFSGFSAVFLAFQLRKIQKFPGASDQLKAKIKALEEEYRNEMKDFDS